MNIEMHTIEFIEASALLSVDLLIIPLAAGETVDSSFQKRDLALYRALCFNLQREKFLGTLNEKVIFTTNGAGSVAKVLVIGLGPREELTALKLQEIGGALARAISELALPAATQYTVGVESAQGAVQLAFGLLLGAWTFDKYKSRTIQKTAVDLLFICQVPAAARQEYHHYRGLYTGIALAREWTSEPANVLYPETYAARCLALAENSGLQVDVFDEEQIQELGAHALLAVGKGSSNSPRLVVLHWKGGAAEQAPIALVGKGVCYDAGGINIKTAHLVEMKWDKAGAGTVVGTLYTLAQMKAPINVVGIIGLVENMPDGNAMKPGDVIQTMAGKTVEVVDTDNEGRLVLADCLCFAQRYNPRVLIDLGTLTLETFGALAGEYAGLFCTEASLASTLKIAGELSGERLWELPMGPGFAKQIASSIADLKNSGRQGFGESSAAAEFLKCFVSPAIPWAHLDISGVAWTQEDQPLCRPGVTGFGVRLLVEWITQTSQAQKRQDIMRESSHG